MKQHILGLAVSTLLVACGGAEADTPTSTNDDGAPPTFAQIYSDLIKDGCSCHLTAEGTGGLAMPDADTAFSNLVEAPANAEGPCEGRVRVVSGSPAQSVLYQKVAGSADLCGSKMPLGGADLSAAQLALLEDWIEAGATRE